MMYVVRVILRDGTDRVIGLFEDALDANTAMRRVKKNEAKKGPGTIRVVIGRYPVNVYLGVDA